MSSTAATAGTGVGPAAPTVHAAVAAAGIPHTAADWREFYDANWPWIYQVVRRLSGRDVDVEDVVQDVFVVLATKLHTFEGRSQLKTWVYRVCLNVTSEHRRRSARQRRIEQAVDAVAFWREPERNAQGLLEASSDIELVREALGKMGEKKREVFVLREIEELSGDEVAEILAIPPATVRTRLFHARKEFARLVEKAIARSQEVVS